MFFYIFISFPHVLPLPTSYQVRTTTTSVRTWYVPDTTRYNTYVPVPDTAVGSTWYLVLFYQYVHTSNLVRGYHACLVRAGIGKQRAPRAATATAKPTSTCVLRRRKRVRIYPPAGANLVLLLGRNPQIKVNLRNGSIYTQRSTFLFSPIRCFSRFFSGRKLMLVSGWVGRGACIRQGLPTGGWLRLGTPRVSKVEMGESIVTATGSPILPPSTAGVRTYCLLWWQNEVRRLVCVLDFQVVRQIGTEYHNCMHE